MVYKDLADRCIINPTSTGNKISVTEMSSSGSINNPSESSVFL